jgi:type II secretory pathway pseudopilin PulG
MDRSRSDAGFTLIELLVVVGMIVVVIATLGVFFLAGPSPAVASAGRDIGAAFAEARETAADFSEATVVFVAAGTGYSARVYRQMPGDAEFQAVNGPTYDSTVAITETAAPLGAPGFAFRIDSRGSVTGYAHFAPTDTTFTLRACPASGAFVLSLAYGNQQRTVTIPCTLSLASIGPGVIVTPGPATSPAPAAPGTCPPSQSCGPPLPAYNATCPPGYTPDATPYVCDSPTPTPSPAPTVQPTSILIPPCPSGQSGVYPNCSSLATPTPMPHPVQKYQVFDGIYACANSDPSCNNGEQFYPVGQVIVLLSNGDVFSNLSDIEQPTTTDLDRELLACIAGGTSVVYSSTTTPYQSGWTAAIDQSGYETQFDAGNTGAPQIPFCDPTVLNCNNYSVYDIYYMGSPTFDFFGWVNSQFNSSMGWSIQGYRLQNC